jgi:hypothetical protein
VKSGVATKLCIYDLEDRATDRKAKPSHSEVVTALVLQDIQYPLARRVHQFIGACDRNVVSPLIV